jgi:capsular polysaccharide biosynthesis protein
MDHLNINSLVPALRRWWIAIVAAAWIAGLAGYVVALQLPTEYEAQTRLLVGPSSGDFDTIRASSQLVQSYAEFATIEPVLAQVVEELDLEMPSTDLTDRIDVTASDVTRILTLRVLADSPQAAVDLATSLGSALSSYIADVDSANDPAGRLSVVEPAVPPLEPVSPEIPFIVLLAAFSGLLAAVLVILLTHTNSDRLRGAGDAALLSGHTVLGQVPALQASDSDETPLVRPYEAAAYRDVATQVELRLRNMRNVLIVAAERADGAGEVSARLAAGFASLGRQVLLVDVDAVHKHASVLLGFGSYPGLSEVLKLGGQTVRTSITGASHRFSFLPFGNAERDAVVQETARAFLDTVGPGNKLILLSAAPLDDSPEGLTWASQVDATIVVGVAGQSTRHGLERTANALTTAGANLLGLVLVASSGPAMGVGGVDTASATPGLNLRSFAYAAAPGPPAAQQPGGSPQTPHRGSRSRPRRSGRSHS